MAWYSTELPTTLELFHYRIEDLFSALTGPADTSPILWAKSEIHRASAYYRAQVDTFDKATYNVEFDTDDDFQMLIEAVSYRPDRLLVTVYYSQDNERETLFAASVASWLEDKFGGIIKAKRPELTEAQEWRRHCIEREDAKYIYGKDKEVFDKERGKEPRTVRGWCRKFRMNGLL